jgi:hypothetical protein
MSSAYLPDFPEAAWVFVGDSFRTFPEEHIRGKSIVVFCKLAWLSTLAHPVELPKSACR